MKTMLKEIKNKYYNLLIYSLEIDYKKWSVEQSKVNYDSFTSPIYDSIQFKYTWNKGIQVIDMNSYKNDIVITFKSYFNYFSKRKTLIRRMVNYIYNKNTIDENNKFITKHSKYLDKIDSSLSNNPEYKNYKRQSKLKRIIED